VIYGGLVNASEDYVLSEYYYGKQSILYDVDMGPDTQFKMGSNSKLFCAVAIYQLQEKGLLNVSDNIRDYLDHDDFVYFGFPNITTYCPKLYNETDLPKCQNITWVQMMSMTSGIIG